MDEGQTPSEQQHLQGSWSLPDLSVQPTGADPASLPWDAPEDVAFDGQFGDEFTPFASNSSYRVNGETFKTARWDLEWKRFRIHLTAVLPHDVRKIVKIRKKIYSYTESTGWTDSPLVEDTKIVLTIPAGDTASIYTYLLPTAGLDERVEYWVTSGGDGIQILSAGFKDDAYNTQTTIKSDDGETVYSDSDDGTGMGQWVDAEGDHQPDPSEDPTERNWPLAFEAGSTMSLHAQISVPDLAMGTPVVVKAKRTGFVDVEWQITATGTLLELPRQASTIPLPDSVQCFSHHSATDAFSVDWSIQIGSQAVQKLGKTHHTLYSILKHTGSAKEETLYALACRGSVGRTTANNGLVSSVFYEFADREVCRVKPTTAEEDGTPMTYRHDSSVSLSGGYSDLLGTRHGRCGHWADLFQEVLVLHGIYPFGSENAAKKIALNLKDPAGISAAYEAAWQEFHPGSVRPAAEPVMFIRNWLIDGGEFTEWNPLDESGVPAQGNPDPSSIFLNHVVMEYGGTIFDPSYGVTYTSYDAWEANAVDYFGVAGLEPGSTSREFVWAGLPNTSSRETEEDEQ